MDFRKDFFYKILYERPYFGTNPVALYSAAKNNKYLLQRFRCLHSLNAHAGCVNTISWNSNGRCILSGSDDLHLSITDAFSGIIKTKIRTGHMTNIFSAKYLPSTDDMKVVSCSGDGVIIYTDLNRPETAYQNIFDCQEESVYDIVTVPNDPNTFLTCSHDHTVRWYDLRVKQSCQKHPLRIGQYRPKCKDDILIHCDYPVTAIAVNQLLPWQLAIGCSDSIIRIYDRRMLSTKSLQGSSLSFAEQNASIVAKFTYDGLKDTNRITSLAYSRNCQQILASYSNDNLYLFNLHEVKSTISNGTEADVISEKPRHQHPPYKRFRLRGDWSDTGPSALTSEELRNNNQQNNSNNNSTSSSSNSFASSQSQSSNTNTSNSSSQSSGSQSSPSNRSSERLRQLNTILNILFRNTFRGNNEGLNESNMTNSSSNTDDMNDSPTISSRQATNNSSTTTNNSNNQEMSTIREQPPYQLPTPRSESSAAAADNNLESSSDNSLGFFIQIFDDDLDYSSYYSSNRENNNEDNDNNGADTSMLMDDDEDGEDDFDSDTTSDSVFNHDSLMNTRTTGGSTSGTRQRSRSSSSNDSRQSNRRKTRNINNSQQRSQQQKPKTMNSSDNRVQASKLDSDANKRLRTYKIKNFKKFAGHRNCRTVIKEATFWGDDYIISGSDCGHIFFWSIETGEVVMILEGDQHVVNCLQPHPTDLILASSGIDYDIKIWGPDSQESLFDPEKAKKLISRNKHLLEESRNTVTVPTRFVLSLFSSIQQRQQRFRDQQRTNDQSSSNTNNGTTSSNWGSSSRDDGWINSGSSSRSTNNNNNELPDHDQDHDMDESC